MGDETGISWTDSTWNPLRGCTRMSEGCRFCYAETVAARFSDPGQPYHGLAERTKSGPRWTGEVAFVHHVLDQPLRWRRPRKIFVNSMSDLFHEKVVEVILDRIFGVMALATQHTFQVLTKRSPLMRAYMTDPKTPERVWAAAMEHKSFGTGRVERWPLPNVWMGVSVENQEAWSERWPDLAATPATVRFLSLEPLIGRIDTCELLGMWWNSTEQRWILEPGVVRPDFWIVGGESGQGARPMSPHWARSLKEQCHAAGGKFWFKQTGSNRTDEWPAGITGKGDALEQWPEELRVHEFPEVARC